MSERLWQLLEGGLTALIIGLLFLLGSLVGLAIAEVWKAIVG